MSTLIKKFSTASGIEYMDTQAKGGVFVLLHGISSGAESWVKQFNELGDEYRLIAWNAPGYGGSRLLTNPEPSAKEYANQLHLLLAELGVKSITIVGHSLGAMIASAYAALYPDEVEHVILVCAAQGYAFADELTKQDVAQKRPKLLAKLGYLAMAEDRGPFLLHINNNENMAILKQVMQGLSVEGFQQTSYLLAYDSIENYLASISCAIDLAYGCEDVITPPKGMFALNEKFSQLKLHAIEDAGHLAYIDQPQAFAKILFNQDNNNNRSKS